MLLISFGSVSGQEDEFESKYFPDFDYSKGAPSLAGIDLDCSPLEEQLKRYLLKIEGMLFKLASLKKEESEILELRLKGVSNLSEQEALERRIAGNELDLSLADQILAELEVDSKRLIPFYTALCK